MRRKSLLAPTKGLAFLLAIMMFFSLLMSYQPMKGGMGTMSYNGFEAMGMVDEIGPEYLINWTFTGDNPDVGITVVVMNWTNYDIFANTSILEIRPVVGYILSNGDKCNDSGIFTIPYIDQWMIAFWHNDTEHADQSTYLITDAQWINTATTPPTTTTAPTTPSKFPLNWKWIGIIIGTSGFVLLLAFGMVIVVIRRRRKPSKKRKG